MKSLTNMKKYKVSWRGLWDSTLKSAIIDAESEDEVEKILKDLDPSTRITFVDCHM